MSAMDLHPEQLFDALRAGTLADHERARLEAHCAQCSACMFELRWLDDGSPAAGEPTAEDRAFGEAAFDNVLRTTTRAKGPRPLGSGRKPFYWGVAGLVVSTCLGLWLWLGRTTWSAPQPTAAPSAAPAAPTAQALASPDPVTREPEPPPVHSVLPQPPAPLPSANALLAAARDAQTRRQLERAQKLYGKLIDVYPKADAAAVARVALGRLHLERAELRPALQLFDDYLRKHPAGNLAEEALYYRALSLDRLGRTRQAERSLRELLTTFPSSVYAAPASARLARGPAQ